MSFAPSSPRRSARLQKVVDLANTHSVATSSSRRERRATDSSPYRTSATSRGRRPEPKKLAADFSTTSTLTTLSELEAELADAPRSGTPGVTMSSSDDGSSVADALRTPSPRPPPSQSALLTPRKLGREPRLPMSPSRSPVDFWHDSSQHTASAKSQVSHLVAILPAVVEDTGSRGEDERREHMRSLVQEAVRNSQSDERCRGNQVRDASHQAVLIV
jgi:hypothetical protein